MKCPHLMKWLSYSCKANEKPYFPSSFQIDEYCKGKFYKKCPFIIKKGQRNVSKILYQRLTAEKRI